MLNRYYKAIDARHEAKFTRSEIIEHLRTRFELGPQQAEELYDQFIRKKRYRRQALLTISLLAAPGSLAVLMLTARVNDWLGIVVAGLSATLVPVVIFFGPLMTVSALRDRISKRISTLNAIVTVTVQLLAIWSVFLHAMLVLLLVFAILSGARVL